jgi:hypothetical protein
LSRFYEIGRLGFKKIIIFLLLVIKIIAISENIDTERSFLDNGFLIDISFVCVCIFGNSNIESQSRKKL